MPVQFDEFQGVTLTDLLDRHIAVGGHPQYEPFVIFLSHGCARCGRLRNEHVVGKCLFDTGHHLAIPSVVREVFMEWYNSRNPHDIWRCLINGFKAPYDSQMDGLEVLSRTGDAGTGENPKRTRTDRSIPGQAMRKVR